MKVHIVERYVSDSDALENYVEKKVETLSRYFDKILKLDVIMEVEGAAHRVQMMGYLVNRKVVKAAVETNDMYASVDQAVDKLQRQLVRYKERLRVPRKTGRPEPTSPRTAPTGPRIVVVDDYPRKPMTPEEAVLELDRSDREFLVFFHAVDDGPAVMFRLEDGKYGLILPRR
ncbi:MAG: ribosome-associated translation inhibitor RaiA [Candidatus Acetothermia bacterium]|jgi:putative sigma-54 modulation protein|nr:ribosome-associated translation inhibitor RaiA [Candidatus Acetothermia bacterium]